MENDNNAMKIKDFEIDNINSIKVNCRVSNIMIIGTNQEHITISWFDTRFRKLKFDLQNGELFIKEKDIIAIYGFFGLLELSKNKEIKLEIPNSYKGNIILETTKEGILCNNLAIESQLNITTNTGFVKMNDLVVDTLNIKAEHGNVASENIKVKNEITIRSLTGNICCNIKGKSSDYKMDCKSSHGKCDIKEYCSSGTKIMNVLTNTGNIKINFI